MYSVNFYSTARQFSYTYVYILFHILFQDGLSQDIEYSSLCYTVGTCSCRKLFTEGKIKILTLGTSLVVQWLRLQAPSAGAWVPSLVRELDPTCLN